MRPDSAPEIDLHGLTVEEALSRLEDLLYSAYTSGFLSARIIHGKGSGALRLAVRRQLSKHPLVSGFRSGLPSEGGDGVTVVELARR